nr:hypothetical protein [Mycolicibacterium sp. PAM1]
MIASRASRFGSSTSASPSSAARTRSGPAPPVVASEGASTGTAGAGICRRPRSVPTTDSPRSTTVATARIPNTLSPAPVWRGAGAGPGSAPSAGSVADAPCGAGGSSSGNGDTQRISSSNTTDQASRIAAAISNGRQRSRSGPARGARCGSAAEGIPERCRACASTEIAMAASDTASIATTAATLPDPLSRRSGSGRGSEASGKYPRRATRATAISTITAIVRTTAL